MGQKTLNDIEGRHIASLTNSQMIVLNLPELQNMGVFSFQIAILEQSQPRIYAYEHGQTPNSYLLVIPLVFFRSIKNKSKVFVELLCLSSITVTVPAQGGVKESIYDVLGSYGLRFREKRGNSVVKIYLEGECHSCYLDFVTFQAVQFTGKNSKQILAMKKQNAYEYCLGSFKEELMPYIYQNEEQSLQEAIQLCLQGLRELYLSLQCLPRFQILYQVMNPDSPGLKQLQLQIQNHAVCRNVTTIGDEECQELVNQELSRIVNQEMETPAQELMRMKENQQQVFLTKILNDLLIKLRQEDFEVNDQKFMFLNSKIVQKVYQIHQEQTSKLREENRRLIQTTNQQEKEIQRLKKQLYEAKKTKDKKEPPLQVIVEEQTEQTPVKTVTFASKEANKAKPTLSIKDLKEPLQMVETNTPSKTLKKTGLTKTKERLREGLKKQEDLRKQRSIKSFKLNP